MNTSSLTQAAGEYLRLGLAVIALTGKTPNVKLHKHGLKDALRGAPESDADWEFIASFMNHPDTTGVGIVIPYPYVVVDIDGEEGAAQWAAEFTTELPTRWVAKTPRLPEGGLHLWFACATPTGSIKLGPKLDLKGQASYVAVYPSQHPDGGIYSWLAAPTAGEPPFEAPEALQTIIEDHAFDSAARANAKTERRQAWGPRYQEGDHVWYAQPGHDSLIEGVKEAAEGNRNNYLHWAAATLAEEGGSDDEFEQLAEAALAVGLEPIEVRRTIRSARRAHG